ncbi:MAG: fibronectin type III domain-containing protein [Rhodoferax sp.]|nr:fibronectin type III domain-containing protein [Rhodoferax sp.]
MNLSRAAFGFVLTAALLLAACGGGGSGPAIKALPQTISYDSAPVLALGGTATVLAKASSGLVVSYSSLTPTVCSVNASTGLVTDLAAGHCSIAADQAGNDDFAPAAQVSQSLRVLVNPAQTLSFGAAPVLTLYGTATVSATASSGLAVRYSSLTPAICAVQTSSGVVTSLAAGNCNIAADQPGDANYNAAAQISQTLTVADGGATVTPPGVPTGVLASLGATVNTVEVRFVGPAVSGGSPVTGYSVASSPTGLSGSGNASPITVTCPSACVGYTLTVQASNRAGAGAPSAPVEVLTSYQIKATFFEPDTQPQDTIFTGTFTLNSTTRTVTGLSGLLTESMTGPPMITVPLTYQLASVSDGQGGLLVSSFALNTTNVYSEGGFAASSEGFYDGFPSAKHPGAPGGVGNAFVTVVVNPADPTAALTAAQINQLAYGDCYPGGMMGDTCMTGYWGRGTMGGYPVAQRITRQ